MCWLTARLFWPSRVSCDACAAYRSIVGCLEGGSEAGKCGWPLDLAGLGRVLVRDPVRLFLKCFFTYHVKPDEPACVMERKGAADFFFRLCVVQLCSFSMIYCIAIIYYRTFGPFFFLFVREQLYSESLQTVYNPIMGREEQRRKQKTYGGQWYRVLCSGGWVVVSPSGEDEDSREREEEGVSYVNAGKTFLFVLLSGILL